MVESEDKNVPLMKPTFFSEDDPDNPKYVDSNTNNKGYKRLIPKKHHTVKCDIIIDGGKINPKYKKKFRK